MTEIPKSRQGLVDRIFHEWMAKDCRFRSQIRVGILAEISALNRESRDGWSVWFPSTYDLHVMISRTASRERPEGGWAYYPAYNEPRRYISIARIDHLCERADKGLLTPEEHTRLKAMEDDLVLAIGHWQDQHRTARERVDQLTHTLVRTQVTTLELREPVQGELLEVGS
jgi:hypothetical protein